MAVSSMFLAIDVRADMDSGKSSAEGQEGTKPEDVTKAKDAVAQARKSYAEVS